VYYQLESRQKSDEQIEKAYEIAPKSPHVLRSKARVAMRRREDPIPFLRAAAESPEAGAGAWGEYALYLMDQNQAAKAEPYLRRAVEAGTNDGRVWAGLGKIAFDRNDSAGAEKLLWKSVELSPRFVQAWMTLAEIQRNQGKADEAIRSLEKAMKAASGPERGVILALLGEAYIGRREWLRAAEWFAKATDYSAVKGPASFKAARCYYFVGRYGAAMKYIDLAHDLAPSDPKVAKWKQKIENARFGPPASASESQESQSFLDVPDISESAPGEKSAGARIVPPRDAKEK
jgi:tetratricopeptide (TPR) repeat protein